MSLSKAREMDAGSEGTVKPQSWGGMNPDWKVRIMKVEPTGQSGNEAVIVTKKSDGTTHSIGGGTIIETSE